ncbi:MAG: tetratricopeptide repeat protein, partial [Gemmataceae bacterium]
MDFGTKMEARWLQGKQVAFTGRLATMTRAEAADMVLSFGGEFSRQVTRDTHFLVVGQEGWPLRLDGNLTRKLEKARKLQQAGSPLAIVAEEDWLERLGLEQHSQGVHRLYTSAQLGRLLRLPRDRIRAWMRAGLIRPAETHQGVCYFDFQQVTGLKTLCDLATAGVSAPEIRVSLEQLQSWLPEVDKPLEQLALIERDGQLLVRLEEGQLAETTGQLHFDFPDQAADDHQPIAFETNGTPTASDWFEQARVHEESHRLEDAAHAYRQALLLSGPDAVSCFNLANVLFELGAREAACERFRQAVELDHNFAEAWNNLGNVLVEMNVGDQAIQAYRRALEASPFYADAHYNLADTLDQLGRSEQARPHWQAYLAQESV